MNSNTPTEDTIDLRDLFFSLIAQWKLIVLCIILSVIAAFLYLRITPDTYSVNALVQVEESKGTSAALLGDLSNLMETKQPAQTEIEILKSRLVLGNVIHKLHLDIKISGTNNSLTDRLLSPPEYRTEYTEESVIFYDDNKTFKIQKLEVPEPYQNKPLILQFSQNKFNLIDLDTEQVVFSGLLNQDNTLQQDIGLWQVSIFTQDQFNHHYLITKQSLISKIAEMSDNYTVAEKGKLSGILGLTYQGQDSVHITQVLNAILAAYAHQNIERSSAETAQTLKFLDEQLPELRQQLDQAEREFNQFRQKHNTVDVNKESELYLTQSIRLETQKAELEQKVAETSARFTSEHPVMQQMEAQRNAIDKKIAELNNTLKQLPDLQRRYLQLYREVEVKQQLYTALLNSYQQLRIAKAGEIGNVRIIDQAISPIEPIKPKKAIILLLSIFIGGFLGVFIALLRNMMRSGIKDAAQIEQELDLPVYATVPRSPLQESQIKRLKKKKNIPLLAVKDSQDIAVESIRSIRTAIHFALNEAKNNVIAISGPSPEVGKSFITVNLAAILAQNGEKVLVIDGDMRRGYLHKYFSQNATQGLSDILLGNIGLNEAIKTSDTENLYFITRGKSPSNPSELLSSQKFKNLLEELSTQFKYILIDTPPALAVTDGIIISQYAGINLLIVRHAQTQIKELEIAQNKFEQANVKLNGVILNDVLHNLGYGYGYGYNYTYGYKATNSKD